jgi:hypothetical protein
MNISIDLHVIHYAVTDMNPSYVEELTTIPSAIEFARFVQRNRPVVFRGLGSHLEIPALKKWTASYLCQVLGNKDLKIAATPEGCVFYIYSWLLLQQHRLIPKSDLRLLAEMPTPL